MHAHTTGALHLIFLKAPNLSRNAGEADRKCQHLAMNSSWGWKEKSQQQLHFLSNGNKDVPQQYPCAEKAQEKDEKRQKVSDLKEEK